MTRQRATMVLALALVLGACGNSDAAPEDAAAASSTTTTEATTTTAAPTTTRPPSDALDADIAAFLAEPGNDAAIALATAMGESGDRRWSPWLLDLMRLGGSSFITEAAIVAFEGFSGIEHDGPNTIAQLTYGNWALQEDIDPGPGYRTWKLEMFGTVDPEFAELLAEVPDDKTLSQILWGGVGRGGIPELNDQPRVSAAEADWMEPDEVVLGVVVNGEAVAYPVRILGHHELANDTVGGVPISLVYCTLCRTALAFDRRVDGQVIDFETSGLLYGSNKIMVDRQTDTLWRHLIGTGIGGELEGVELEQFSVVTILWEDWLAEHPDTETLTFPRPIFFQDQPERAPIAYDYSPGAAYAHYYSTDQELFPIFDTPDTFPIKTDVLGIELDGTSVAWEVDSLVNEPPTVFAVGERRVLIVPTRAGGRIYDASGLPDDVTDGTAIELAVDEDEIEEDVTTVDGETLPRLVAEQSFWFAWYQNHPETETWPAS